MKVILLKWREGFVINLEMLQGLEIKRTRIFRQYYLAGYILSRKREAVFCSHEFRDVIEGTLEKIIETVEGLSVDEQKRCHVIDISKLFYGVRDEWREQLERNYDELQARRRRREEEKQQERKKHGLI